MLHMFIHFKTFKDHQSQEPMQFQAPSLNIHKHILIAIQREGFSAFSLCPVYGVFVFFWSLSIDFHSIEKSSLIILLNSSENKNEYRSRMT